MAALVPAGALDLAAVASETGSPHRSLFAAANLQPLLAAGPSTWRAVARELDDLTADPSAADLVAAHTRPLAATQLHLPFDVADYVDFYASAHHASRLGRLFRPGQPPLPAAWPYLPLGYHGRAGTVVVSGTPVTRPNGQRLLSGHDRPSFGPSVRLDFEAEIGFVVGVPSAPGVPVTVEEFDDHVFGVVLVNDWSARDLQSLEYVPLGPFLGKSFATSVAGFVTPLSALSPARLPAREHEQPPPGHLADRGRNALGLTLEIELNGEVVSRPPSDQLYWTPAQLIAHLTSNGAPLRTGDLVASGTVSGPADDEVGSLIELTNAGASPLHLADGSTRSFLEDGDTVVIRAHAPGGAGPSVPLAEVAGTVLPAPPTTR